MSPRCAKPSDEIGAPVPPTLRDVAARAGVSVATVSMALRSHPRVSVATRMRIQELAREMGYAQDSSVARLMHYLRRKRVEKAPEPLAFVTRLREEDLLRFPTFHRQFLGATRRAAELGYRLDFHTVDGMMNERRLGRVLRARGVRGVVIGPQIEPEGRLDLGWEHFASVAIGYSFLWPDTDRVINDKMQSVYLAMLELRRLGYRRPGFVMEQWVDDRLRNHWTGAFLSCQFRHWPADTHVPPMVHPSDRAALVAWFERWRPDVLIGVELAEPLRFLVEDLGVRVPEDVAFAVLDKQTEGPFAGHAGIDQHPERIGEAAIDMLSAYLMRNELGVSGHPRVVSLPGVWVDGETAPPRTPVN